LVDRDTRADVRPEMPLSPRQSLIIHPSFVKENIQTCFIYSAHGAERPEVAVYAPDSLGVRRASLGNIGFPDPFEACSAKASQKPAPQDSAYAAGRLVSQRD
jgi:hypothetical protein